MTDKLDPYRQKRNAGRTPEPVPDERPTPTEQTRYVIHEHHARALHWDLRLERDGVLACWAIPKGLPQDPGTNHLAVHTEDHPIEYLDFSGDIPKGEYGGGTMTVWDQGTYTTEKWDDREVKLILDGERAKGRFVLFRTRGKDWMIHLMGEATRDPLPPLDPMLPVERAKIPRDPGDYAFEFAWGGRRLLVPIDGGRTTAAQEYGWLRPLAEGFGSRTSVLDGEIVTLNGAQIYACYDLLYDDGHSLVGKPFSERRAALESLGLAGARWQTAPSFPAQPQAVRQAAREQGLPGIVGKRLDSTYEPGESKAWILIGN